MGGRAAEELVFGAPTTGASSDIEHATKIARSMLTEYGFSPDLGTVKYGQEQGDPFSHLGGGGSIDYSDAVAAKIDEQMAYLLDSAHRQAYDILAANRDYLDTLAEMLLEKETLRRPDLEGIFEGIEPREAFEVFPNEDERFPRQAGREPVKTPVELAKERGEELPKRMTLLDASRAARERRLAAQENGQPAPNTTSEEIGFSFGQHAGDVVDPEKGNTFFGDSDSAASSHTATASGSAAHPETETVTDPAGREQEVPEEELREQRREHAQAPQNSHDGFSHDETQEIPRVNDAPEPQRQQAEPERRGRHAKPEEQGDREGYGTQGNRGDLGNLGWGAPGWGEQEHRSNPYKDGQNNER